jgi:hypothetical protein
METPLARWSMNKLYHRIGLATLGWLLLASCVTAEEVAVLNNPGLPNWIWVQERSYPASAQLSRTLILRKAIQSAELRFTADFCHAQVEIERSKVLNIAPYSPTQTLDVTKHLKLGINRIEVSASSVPGAGRDRLFAGNQPSRRQADVPHFRQQVAGRGWRDRGPGASRARTVGNRPTRNRAQSIRKLRAMATS